MKTSPTTLEALSPDSANETILVRATRIWEAINKKNGSVLHTNVILLDEKENRILAIIRNNQKHLYLQTLVEGDVYAISNFKVVPGPKIYKPVDAAYSLNFYYKTRIENAVDTAIIPQHKFDLVPFATIPSLVGNVELLIDVIGMVKSYGKPEKRAGGAQKVDVVLSNDSNNNIMVTLWEERAKQFLDLMLTSEDGPAFMVVTGLLAKKFSDAASLSSTDATRCYVNIDYTPITTLRETLTTGGNGKQAKLPAPKMEQVLTSTGTPLRELPISAILETTIPAGTQVVRCICRAKITDVLGGNGWFYNCCPTCGRSLRDLDGKFFCLSCEEETPKLEQRFRIVAKVEDPTGTTTLTLFNKEAEQLVGIPLQKVLAEITEVEHIPPVVRNIIGKFCAFHIKITPYNIIQGCEEFTVTRLSADAGEVPDRVTKGPHTNVETDIPTAVNKKRKLA